MRDLSIGEVHPFERVAFLEKRINIFEYYITTYYIGRKYFARL